MYSDGSVPFSLIIGFVVAKSQMLLGTRFHKGSSTVCLSVEVLSLSVFGPISEGSLTAGSDPIGAPEIGCSSIGSSSITGCSSICIRESFYSLDSKHHLIVMLEW